MVNTDLVARKDETNEIICEESLNTTKHVAIEEPLLGNNEQTNRDSVIDESNGERYHKIQTLSIVNRGMTISEEEQVSRDADETEQGTMLDTSPSHDMESFDDQGIPQTKVWNQVTKDIKEKVKDLVTDENNELILSKDPTPSNTVNGNEDSIDNILTEYTYESFKDSILDENKNEIYTENNYDKNEVEVFKEISDSLITNDDINKMDMNSPCFDMFTGKLFEDEDTANRLAQLYNESHNYCMVGKGRLKFGCFRGEKRKSESLGIRKAKPTNFTGCPAKITFYKRVNGHVRLTKVELRHNHDLYDKGPRGKNAPAKVKAFDWNTNKMDMNNPCFDMFTGKLFEDEAPSIM